MQLSLFHSNVHGRHCLLIQHQYIISDNELPTCTGHLSDVNVATVKMRTAASMKCQCNLFSKKMRNMNFALHLEVTPNGVVPYVCISPVGSPNNLAPLRTTECIHRYTHFSRDPVFCGFYICIRVFFRDDGFCAVRITGRS